MSINVKVFKNDKGDAGILLKRFQKKMQESGIVPKVKSRKHSSRATSKLKTKKDKLVKIEAARKYETLRKMGKLQVRTFRPQTKETLATTTTPASK
jgi:ribosomal protein S21